MTERDFCYWLQGYFELMELGLKENSGLTDLQTAATYDHLKLVFDKVTQDRTTKTLQEELEKLGPITPTRPGYNPSPRYCDNRKAC